ncbi:hypothetical protein AgCh_015021 [Apium graveolens]
MTIDTDNKFQMRNLIQDMRRKLGRRTHLILRGNVWDDLQYLEEKSDIEGLVLGFRISGYGQATAERMPKLRLLQIIGCRKLRKLPQDIGIMEGLEIFVACFSAIEQLPDSFGGLVNLVQLGLSYCKKLRNLPNSICNLKLLKQLDVTNCSNLEQLPEQLGKMQYLDLLDASYTAIEQVPDSIGLLGSLRMLFFGDCKKLKFVPESIWNRTSVEELSLNLGETDRISLPDSVKDMKKLRDLNLQLPLNLEELCIDNHTSLEQLPDLSSLGKLRHLNIQGCINLQSISLLPSHLESLIIEECTSLRDVPDLSMLKELVRLSFTGCNNLKLRSLEQSFLQVGPFEAILPNTEVAEWFNYKSSGHTVSFVIPPGFGSNFLGVSTLGDDALKKGQEIDKELKKLSNLLKVHPSIEQLSQLCHLDLNEVGHLRELPETVAQLTKLGHLDLRGCHSLKRLPEQLGNLKGLKVLDSSYTPIEQLPDSVAHLLESVELKLISCKKLRKLPEQFGEMEGLRSFHASSSAIEQLPDSFGHLINLVDLQLSNCQKLSSLSNSIWKLKLLKILRLSGQGLASMKLCGLSKLFELQYRTLENCTNLGSFPELPPNLIVVGRDNFSSFTANLPNREVAEWFSYKSNWRTVSLEIPPDLDDRFLEVALWIVCTCKTTNQFRP